MINKSIFGYAMLDYMSEQKKDILDMYIPLVCHSIAKGDIEGIDNVVVKKLLKDDYGLDKITYGAIDAILAKMHRDGLIDGPKTTYKPLWGNISKITRNKIEIGIENDYIELCKAILEYAKTYSQEAKIEDVDNALMIFVEQYGAEIIIDENKFSTKLSRKKRTSTLNYIISKFVLEKRDSHYALILEKIAKGAVISRIISMEHFDEYKGKMKGVVIALDAPIIYSLLGLNGDGAKLLNEELINLLEDQGCTFKIFNQHYNEVQNTLADAAQKLITKKFDIRYASRVLRYALRENLSSDQIQAKIIILEELVNNKHIEVSDAPDCSPKYHDIDVAALEEDIAEIYHNSGSSRMYDFTKERIANDADVISYIFRIRNDIAATNLKNCRALLVTNNSAIAYASRNHKYSKVSNMIPPCVTDVFLSTMLWLNYPQHNASLNKKILLDICFCNTTLDNALLCKFYERAEKAFEQDAISDESVLVMKHSKLAMQLLEQKTCNDIDLYTDKTFDEIIQDLEVQEYKEKKQLQDQIAHIEKRVDNIASIITKGTFLILEIVLLTAFIWVKFISLTNWDNVSHITSNILYILVVVISSTWGVLSWMNVLPRRINSMQIYETWIKDQLKSFWGLKKCK